MSLSDSFLMSRKARFTFLKPVIVLSFMAATAFTTTPVKDGNIEAVSYEARTANPKVMQLREWVAGYAQNFVGLHYRYAGVSPRTGFDCSGFTSYILKEFDLKASCSSAMQSTQGQRISLDEILPGDLIFFGSKTHIQHVAMVVECAAEGIICVHSTCSRGIIVENISTSKYWKPKILFARDVITGQSKTCREIASAQ
jgi:cell wall-associated NlpC family hydrolase